ncbi:MAG: hypothetical protein JST31_11085 [Actinobacteria bacterium]|nr:hypothetical protein [Actinomycetota bacterium]
MSAEPTTEPRGDSAEEPLMVSECTACGYLAYPPRLLCPGCGGSSWRPRPAGAGVATEVTVRRPVFERRQLPSGEWVEEEPTRLGAVSTEGGVRIIARLEAGIEAGGRVALVRRDGVAVAVEGS